MSSFSDLGPSNSYGKLSGIRDATLNLALGCPTLSNATVAGLIESIEPGSAQVSKLNSFVLRTAVDCFVVGDSYAKDAAADVAAIACKIHAATKSGAPFITHFISTGSSEAAQRLCRYLSVFDANPRGALRLVRENLKFDECLPNQVKGDYQLLEDALARAAVAAQMAKDPALAQQFAFSSIVFRCPEEAILSRRAPCQARLDALDRAQSAVGDEITPLVDLSRTLLHTATRMDEDEDLLVLAPLVTAFESVNVFIGHLNAWRPVSYVSRAEFMEALAPICDPELASSFPEAEPVLDCFAVVKRQFNSLEPLSAGSLAEYMMCIQKLLGERFFEGARIWMRALARQYGMRLG